MRYLIDGYNLLFATGRLTPRAPKHALEASRHWLLVELVRAHGANASAVTVVFDAASAPGRVPKKSVHGGVVVLFSRGSTADDMIEEIIGEETNPTTLTVVSDDHRIKLAAKRRGCPSLGCLDYCEMWTKPMAKEGSPTGEVPKPERGSAEENRRWLEAFGDIDDPLYHEPF